MTSATQAIDKRAYGETKLAQWGVADRQLTNRQAWLTFWCLFAFGASCVYQWQMIAPVMVEVGMALNIPLSDIGFLMSVYTIAGLILAYPCTWVMQKFGIKFSLMVTACLSLIGNVICLMSSGATLFFVGRALQGCGFGLIAVLGPNIMPRLFPPAKMGLVMGIWSQWVTPGIALGALSTPLIFQSFGWQAIYYLSSALTIITAILVLLFVKMPLVPENVIAAANTKELEKKTTGKVYVKSAMVVGFGFVAWTTLYAVYNTTFPTYCQEVLGMPMMASSMTTLVTALVTIPTGIAVGILTDKIRQRKVLLISGYAITMLLVAFFMFRDTGVPMNAWISAVILGAVCAALVPTCTRAIIPVLAQRPRETDWALTGMAFVTQAGGLIAGFFMTVVAGYGWGTAGLAYGLGACIIGIAMLIPVKNDHSIAPLETEGREVA